MGYSRTARFRKLRTCPQSKILLTQRLGAQTSVAAHVASCDFCGAESQLLSRFPPQTAAIPLVAFPVPPGLQRLAQDILAQPSQNRARFVESILEIERLTLTDA